METQDPVDDCIAKLMQLAKSKPGGISNEDIVADLSDVPTDIRLKAMNKMIQQQLFDILKKGDSLIYRAKDPSKKPAIDMDKDERIIYNIIEASGNTGIWVKDIRTKSNLLMTPLTKMLKNLENRKLIKAVKSVNASKKKVYMLYNLEPARSVTGGPWYENSDFESEFADVLNQQCLRFLQQKKADAKKLKESPISIQLKSLCTIKEVHEFITNLGISKIALEEGDVATILNTVVYDGKAQKIMQTDGSYLYKAIESLLPPEGIVQSPCGLCCVMRHCSDIGSITPKTCVYMNEWLE
jgi:DNA-directed RNA polymerase III subunit RPC6